MTDGKVLRYMNLNIVQANQQTAPDFVYRLVDVAHETRSGFAIHLSNAYTLACARVDADVATAVSEDLSFPDGVPLARLTSLWDSDVGQVYGPGLMQDCLKSPKVGPLRHFLFGSSEEVGTALEAHIRMNYPNANIVGRLSPEFGPLSDSARAEAVRQFTESCADVIWVGLGTPRQDLECHALRKMYPGVFIAVGAAFDFLPGIKQDCPEWIRKAGLQWLHRLLTEPKRLWKRYLVGNTVFLTLAAIQGWRKPTTQPLSGWLSEQR